MIHHHAPQISMATRRANLDDRADPNKGSMNLIVAVSVDSTVFASIFPGISGSMGSNGVE